MNNELDINLSEMSNEQLIEFKTHLEKGYDKLCEDRAKELKQFDTEEFDPFSFLGKKKVDNIVKKYAELDDGYTFLMEELLRELQQRQISLLDVETNNLEKLSDEDYIYRQIEKSEKFKQKNKNDDYK